MTTGSFVPASLSAQARLLARRHSAIISLLLALGAGIILFSVWSLLRSQASLGATQRRLSDVIVNWTCVNGHRFRGPGAHVSIRCPECAALAHVAVTYACPRDGEIPALVRYERDRTGYERLVAVSFRTGVWTDVRHAVLCPQCGDPLTPRDEVATSIAGQTGSPP